MKTLILVLLLGLSQVCFAQQEKPVAIISNQAIRHIDEFAEVTGLVTSLGRGRDGTVYLNFGQPYPHQHLYIILPPGEAEDLGGADWLKNRLVRVTGIVREKDGRAVMLITNINQLVDVEEGMRPRYPIKPD